jgi:HEAT repeat protein
MPVTRASLSRELLLLLAAGCATAPPREGTFVPVPPSLQPIEQLLTDLESLSPGTRAKAAWMLAGAVAPDRRVLDALHTAYLDGDEKVREAAAWALGHLEAGAASKPDLYDEPPRAVRMTRPMYPQDAFTNKVAFLVTEPS